jgi:hypothetical protein
VTSVVRYKLVQFIWSKILIFVLGFHPHFTVLFVFLRGGLDFLLPQ